MAPSAGLCDRGDQCPRIAVADIDQFAAPGMLGHRFEVIAGDAAATCKGESDLSISDVVSVRSHWVECRVKWS